MASVNNPGWVLWLVECTLQKLHEPLGKGGQLFLTHSIMSFASRNRLIYIALKGDRSP